MRQEHVVVDAFGDLNDFDCSVTLPLDCNRASDKIVAPDRNQGFDAQFLQRGNCVGESLCVASDVAAGRAQHHAAVQMDPRDLVYCQLVLLVGESLAKPLKSVVKPDRRTVALDRLDCYRRDDSVSSRSGTSTYKNSNSFYCHLLIGPTLRGDSAPFF